MRKRMIVGMETDFAWFQRRERRLKGDRRGQGDNNRPQDTDPSLRLDKQKGEEKVRLFFLPPILPSSLPGTGVYIITAEMLLTSNKRREG